MQWKIKNFVLQSSVSLLSDAFKIPRNLATGSILLEICNGFLPQKFVTDIYPLSNLRRKTGFQISTLWNTNRRIFKICERMKTAAMNDGFDFPSQMFSDPHYYDGFSLRRKIRQKDVCYGISPVLRRIRPSLNPSFLVVMIWVYMIGFWMP